MSGASEVPKGGAAGSPSISVPNWAALDPAVGSSVRMAIDLGLNLEHAAETEAASEAATADRFRRIDGAEEELDVQSSDDDAADSKDALLADRAVDDDEGMAMPMASSFTEGDQTYTDSQWQLDKLIRRRRLKCTHVPVTDLPDTHDDEDIRYEYLCRWSSSVTGEVMHTWESRGWLQDAGFHAEVEVVDTRLRSDVPHRAATRSHHPTPKFVMGLAVRLAQRVPPGLASVIRLIRGRLTVPADDRDVYKALIVGAVQSATDGCPDAETLWTVCGLVAAAFERASRDALGFRRFQWCEPETATGFMRSVEGRSGSDAKKVTNVRLLYHGTASYNADSISRRGLLVPGQEDIRVVHGNAYGVGIYAALAPQFANGYATDGTMFLCLAKDSCIAQRPAFFVYGTTDNIIPIVRLCVTTTPWWRVVPARIDVGGPSFA